MDQPESLPGTPLSSLVVEGQGPGHGIPGTWWVEAEAVLPVR